MANKLQQVSPAAPRFLIVDDELQRCLTAWTLRHLFECSVEQAPDAKQAMDALSLIPFDVVIFGCDMPYDGDGFWFVREIRKSSPPLIGTRILLVSGDVGDKKEALAVGANGFLYKSFSRRELQAAIIKILPDVKIFLKK